MATIRKRSWKSGGVTKTAWVADYIDQGGKRHLKTCKTKKEADAFLVQARHEIARGVHTPDSASITIAGAAALWLDKVALNKRERSTLLQYRNHVGLHINSKIGGMRLARLSTPMVEAFCDEMLKGMSRPMARKVLASLKGILSEAQRRGFVAQNAAQPVRIGAQERERQKLVVGRDIPTKAEANTILSKASGRLRPLYITAIFTGMRASELRGLTWDDVDFDAKEIHVRQRANLWGEIGPTKSAAGQRAIPMVPMLLNVLREWKLACPRLQKGADASLWLVFPNAKGKVENHPSILAGLHALQIANGIVDGEGQPKYGMHSLRHFFASWLIEQDFSPKRTQAILGHSSIQMTYDVYGHLFPNREDEHARFAAGQLSLIASGLTA